MPSSSNSKRNAAGDSVADGVVTATAVATPAVATTKPQSKVVEVDAVAKRARKSPNDDDSAADGAASGDGADTTLVVAVAVGDDLDTALNAALAGDVEAVKTVAATAETPTADDAGVVVVSAVERPVARKKQSASGGSSTKPDRMSRWDANLSRLISYIAEHGNARVPQSFNTEKYPKLGKWVSRQRDAYRNEQLRRSGTEPKRSERIDDGQIARLNALKFEWAMAGRKKRVKKTKLKPEPAQDDGGSAAKEGVAEVSKVRAVVSAVAVPATAVAAATAAGEDDTKAAAVL